MAVAAQAPAAEAKPLFLQYAALEEGHGLARAAMAVYDRAVRTVPEAERAAVYDLYLARAHELFGLGKARTAAARPCQSCPVPWPCSPILWARKSLPNGDDGTCSCISNRFDLQHGDSTELVCMWV